MTTRQPLRLVRTGDKPTGGSAPKRKKRRRGGKPRLIIHGVSAEEWTRRYGVEPFSHPCYTCKALRTADIPFRQGTLVGFTAPEKCACGDGGAPFAMMRDPKYGDLFDHGGRLDE